MVKALNTLINGHKILFCLSMISISLISCKEAPPEKMIVATSANMQYAMEELQASFTKETGIPFDIITSSSGKLTAQIKAGAPFNILVSADMKYPIELYEEGLTISKPILYAYGNLVIWTLNKDITPTLDALIVPSIEHVAIANPKTAPYGNATLEVLRHTNIFDSVESKLVYGESISQINQFIVSKVADLGFTAKSVVMSPKMKGKGQWVAIDGNLYTPLQQGAVVLNVEENHTESAKRFLDFLVSDKGKEILTKFGYTVNE